MEEKEDGCVGGSLFAVEDVDLGVRESESFGLSHGEWFVVEEGDVRGLWWWCWCYGDPR